MRVAADEFFADCVNGGVDGEKALFFGHFSKEDGLQQEVAEFFGQAGPIPLVDGFENFVGFFEKERLDGVEGLFPVPGAPTGRPEARHDGDEPFEFFTCRYFLG